MAWTTARTWVAGELVTAPIGNTHWRDNLNALRDGGIAIALQGANEIIYASSATQLARSVTFTFDGNDVKVPRAVGIGATTPSTAGIKFAAATPAAVTASLYSPDGAALYFNGSQLATGASVSGTTGKIAKFTASTALGDSIITESGATISVAGTVSSTVFGSHIFSAGGTGGNILQIRNTTAGVANLSRLRLDTDTAAVMELSAFSSTFTTLGPEIADGVALRGLAAGGLALAATHASGLIGIYTGGTTRRGQITAAGLFAWATLGDHEFSAGGAGSMTAQVRAESAGIANFAAWLLGSDLGNRRSGLRHHSSTFTAAVPHRASGMSLYNGDAGGVSVAATDAAGYITFHAGGTGEDGRMHASGGFSWGDATDPGAGNIRIAGTSTLVGAVLGTGGTAAAPTYSFIGNTNYGMYLSGSSIMIVRAGVDFIQISTAFGGAVQSVLGGAWGTGGTWGSGVSVGRNTSGLGAAGWFRGTTKSGALNYIWADDSGIPGKLRISDVPPEEDGVPSDTSGTVVGDQTSWHEHKRVLRQQNDPRAALDVVLRTKVYDFEYLKSSYMNVFDESAMFTGLVGYDRHDWFLKNVGSQQVPCLNDISLFGHLVLSVQALAEQIRRIS